MYVTAISAQKASVVVVVDDGGDDAWMKKNAISGRKPGNPLIRQITSSI